MSCTVCWYNACRIGGRETNRVNMFAMFCECKQSLLPLLQLHHNLWSSNKHNYTQLTLHDQSSMIKFRQLITASECPMRGCKPAAESMQRSRSRSYALSPPHICPPCSWAWKLHLLVWGMHVRCYGYQILRCPLFKYSYWASKYF